MELKELREKNDVDLEKLLASVRETFRDLNFRDSQGQLKNVRDIRKAKKTIAQIMTIQKERVKTAS